MENFIKKESKDNKDIHNEEDTLNQDKERSNCCEDMHKLEIELSNREKNIAYLRADIDNIKKNMYKEIQVSIDRKVEKIFLSLLSVFDDYERSLEYAKKIDNKDLVAGLKITFDSFKKIFKEYGITEVDVSCEFNPEIHEAITTIADENRKSNSISEVIQKGFLYNKKLLRAAKVIIVS